MKEKIETKVREKTKEASNKLLKDRFDLEWSKALDTLGTASSHQDKLDVDSFRELLSLLKMYKADVGLLIKNAVKAK